jgi:hypothetical protein
MHCMWHPHRQPGRLCGQVTCSRASADATLRVSSRYSFP